MSRIERYAKLLEGVDLSNGVAVEGRVFVGSEEIVARVRMLEEIHAWFKGFDVLGLYDRTVAFDGAHEEDINLLGRYFAYYRYELKGVTPEEKDAALDTHLAEAFGKWGKELVMSFVPRVQKGRQITESLKLRPENEDYPSYYSKVRTDYAEKMAAVEIPKAVLDSIRAEQEHILDRYDWNTLYVVDREGTAAEICGDVYLLSDANIKRLAPYGELWETLATKGAESLYEKTIQHDGVYPPDEHNTLGRYFAYVRLELRGLNADGRAETVKRTIPESIVKAIGLETILELLPTRIDGEPVTQPLTIRPEDEEFPSYYSKRLLERNVARAYKQVLYDTQAEIIARIAGGDAHPQKYVILETAG